MSEILYYPVIDEKRVNWKKLLEKIESWFFKNVVSDFDKANAILVWWWDGFMIHTMKKYFNNWKIFFGLNCGTLWFLLNDFDSELPNTLEKLDVVRWYCLDVEILKNNRETIHTQAINDVVIWWNILDYFNFQIEWKSLSESIKWTWLIVSTSFGSSGYRLSNGWPVMPIQSEIFWIMWIAAKPFNYHILKNQNIKIISKWRQKTLVWIDWYYGKIDDVKEISIFPSKKYVELWFLLNKDFDTKRINLSNQKLSGLKSI